MSTQSPYQQTPYQSSYQQTPYQPTPYQPTPYQQSNGPSWFAIWAVVVGTAVVAAFIVLAVSLWHGHSSAVPGTTRPSTSTSVPAHPTTPISPVTPAHPTAPVTPPAQPTVP
jgi:hypothetical protein